MYGFKILQWEKIEDEKFDALDFDPRLPQKTFKKGKGSHGHTWAKYAVILDQLINNSLTAYPSSFTENKKIEQSFFSRCFMTELNYMPSPSSRGNNYVKNAPFFEQREKFLKDNIIPRFEVIIIGAWAYFNTDDENELKKELTALFGEVEKCERVYSDGESFPFLHYKGKESNQQIFITKQLSSLSKWQDDQENRTVSWEKKRVINFAKRIKANLAD